MPIARAAQGGDGSQAVRARFKGHTFMLRGRNKPQWYAVELRAPTCTHPYSARTGSATCRRPRCLFTLLLLSAHTPVMSPSSSQTRQEHESTVCLSCCPYPPLAPVEVHRTTHPAAPFPCSTPSVMERLNSLQLKFEARQKLQSLKNDMLVLKNIWFKKLQVGVRGSACVCTASSLCLSSACHQRLLQHASTCCQGMVPLRRQSGNRPASNSHVLPLVFCNPGPVGD